MPAPRGPLHGGGRAGRPQATLPPVGAAAVRGEHYGDDAITAEDVFAYTYAALHDPAYREKYAVDLLREFPRLRFYEEFAPWARMGRELLDLHTRV